mmetsp:Transcript_59608/g.134873  ORF Transcript_59608/g.134873 Transcript_59608/m.134873 type:complete len:205 (+) Transcript_59608:183-797(+)
MFSIRSVRLCTSGCSKQGPMHQAFSEVRPVDTSFWASPYSFAAPVSVDRSNLSCTVLTSASASASSMTLSKLTIQGPSGGLLRAVGLKGFQRSWLTMSSNKASRLPASHVGFALMLRCGRVLSHRFFGSSISQRLQLTGQLTIIQPGFRSHSPLRASCGQRRCRSWQLFVSTLMRTSAGRTYSRWPRVMAISSPTCCRRPWTAQ